MAFIVHTAERKIKIDRSKKILKASDAWAFFNATEIISDAEKKRSEILSTAISAFEYEQRRGYAEGTNAALQEQAENMAVLITQTVEYFGRIEKKISDLVLSAVKKIIGEISDEEKFINIVRSSLSLIRSQTALEIRVNPSNVSLVESNLSELRKKFPSLSHIKITEDESIKIDTCIIDSEIGRIESSISGQLHALSESLKNTFGNTIDNSDTNGK